MSKVTTLIAILLSSSACHDSVYERAVATVSAQESDNSPTNPDYLELLRRETQDLKNTLAVIKTQQAMLGAVADVEANKTLILEECLIYIAETFNEAAPVRYLDYDAEIGYRLPDGSNEGYYTSGCRIYLGKSRKTGESWRMVPTYQLKAQRIARLHAAKIKRTADKQECGNK